MTTAGQCAGCGGPLSTPLSPTWTVSTSGPAWCAACRPVPSGAVPTAGEVTIEEVSGCIDGDSEIFPDPPAPAAWVREAVALAEAVVGLDDLPSDEMRVAGALWRVRSREYHDALAAYRAARAGEGEGA